MRARRPGEHRHAAEREQQGPDRADGVRGGAGPAEPAPRRCSRWWSPAARSRAGRGRRRPGRAARGSRRPGRAPARRRERRRAARGRRRRG
ncbi:hypothetical protein G5V59_09060 [Nocardioides sp. W3-2-3]|nr:hypothetical protein [Nocardioides convexus]